MPKVAYQTFNFRPDSLALINTCNQIIAEYQAAGFVLTLRQLYYQLVSRDVIANRQQEYKRVGSIINDARLAGLIDWNALEDRTRNVRSISHWESPESIIEAVAEQYRMDKWQDCEVRPEVWIEKDALVGVIEGVCEELDVSYFSCRGYTSQSEMWGAAQRFIRYARKGQRTHIIHLGDHDPSGQDMSRDIEERIRMFLSHHIGHSKHFEFTRIALNMDQIERYDPPPNPAKSTDSRFGKYRNEHGDESWELDALEPTVLAALIRAKVGELRDDDLYKRIEDEEGRHRELLGLAAQRWESVAEMLRE
ncbi:hypothetical protein [Edaphobacter dinghuensis]|uniref:Uncharacterized protein n=1 Tax=Edaphobacter dinghuensis TaxID=1560005 RepID=A0A917HPW6_9BACT|nr:hypothetical protein [Edaphobacter dinghuensis]GGG86615.1 hypothetical protein GCM10011585_33220 [Edaphobacter dinghuensis]